MPILKAGCPAQGETMWTVSLACLVVGLFIGCRYAASEGAEESLESARQRMIRVHLRGRGIADDRVLKAMAAVPREEFVPAYLRSEAYADRPLPIGLDQTISQPYIVAYMTQVVDPRPTDRALEIGTGSGYQAAVLSLLVDSVYTVEILDDLTQRAKATLARLGYHNVVAATRDGYEGWSEHAPFNVIIVTAAPDHVPQPLVDQLAPGGRLIIPVGDFWQELRLIIRQEDGVLATERKLDVRFVPMTGRAQEKARR